MVSETSVLPQRGLGELELIPARGTPQDNTKPWLERVGRAFLVGGKHCRASSWKSGVQEAGKCFGGTPGRGGVKCGSAGDKIPRV